MCHNQGQAGFNNHTWL